MDTQAKIIFKIEVLNSDYNRSEVKFIDDRIYPDGNLGEEFIKFHEHDKITVTFECEDENALLEIDCYDLDGTASIKPSGSYIITSGKDNDDMMVPGYYSITLKTTMKTYNGLYIVEPSSISWEGLMNMRMYLENILEGLSYNLYVNKAGYQAKNVQHSIILSELYNHIRNNEDVLKSNIDSLIKSPITSLQGKYREQLYSKNADFKSQKWLSLKGTSLNSNPNFPDIVYEKHTVLDRNTSENKWVKKIIHHTVEVLCAIENNYNSILNSINAEIENKYHEYKIDAEDYNNRITNNIALSEGFKNRKKKRIQQLYNEICVIQKNVEFINDILNNIKKIRSVLSHNEYNTWLKDIKKYEKIVKPTKELIKDYRYAKLYNFYEKLNAIENNTYKSKNKNSPNKRTSKLFEYYVVAMIIKIIEINGYEWTDGWLADKVSHGIYNGELPSETVMHFSNENLCCEFAYDMEIEGDSKNIPWGKFVRNNARFSRPDIKLALYNKNTGELKGAVIIEVKCRKTKYIYSDSGDTSVIEQLNDYYNFGYKNPSTNRVDRGRIDSVIVIYPKQQNVINYNGNYEYSFIQIDPSQNIEDAFGFMNLEEKIKAYMPL